MSSVLFVFFDIVGVGLAGLLFALVCVFGFRLNKKPALELKYLLPLFFVLAFHALLQPHVTLHFRMIFIVAICVIISFLSRGVVFSWLRYLTVFLSLAFFAGLFSKFLVLAGALDLQDWHISQLAWVSEDNPAFTRYNYGYGDFEYYMPLYLASWQVPGHWGELGTEIGPIVFHRFPFIFVEPTQVAFFVAPLLYAQKYLFSDKTGPRIFFQTILICMLLWSFSYAGLIAVFFALPLILFAQRLVKVASGKRILSRLNVQILNFLMLVLCIAAFSYADSLLTVIGGNKMAQLEYFRQRLIWENFTQLLGQDIELTAGSTYGILTVFVRYGVLGVLAMILPIVVVYIRCLRTTQDFRSLAPLLTMIFIHLKHPDIMTVYLFLMLMFCSVVSSRAETLNVQQGWKKFTPKRLAVQ